MEDTPSAEPVSSAPKGRTVIFVAVCLLFILLGIGAWLAYRMNTAPSKECAYRGGIWSLETDSCIFEGGSRGGTHEQSGQVLPTITLRVPDTDVDIIFEGVEVGGTKAEHSKEFATPDMPVKGVVYLVPELSRVHKESGDLLMPFIVGYGGTGAIYFLGVFKKTDTAFALASSQFVGDRVGLDSLSLSSLETNGTYTARLLYRDRKVGEPMAAIPTEPRALEVVVLDHKSDTVFVTSRDGLLYKDILKVSAPKLRESVSSPLTIEGEARGNWFFEASFPVSLTDWDGKIIADGIASAKGEWMTEDFVPFTATLTFVVPETTPSQSGTLILRKDNPSGLPEHDDAFEIPVTFK